MRRPAVLLVGLALLVAACGGSAPHVAKQATTGTPPSNQPKALTHVILADYSPAPIVSSAPYWAVPYGLGYFQREGLDVSWQQAGGSTEGLQLVVSGRAQFAESNGEPVMIADQKGAKLKSFFEQLRSYGDAMVVLKSGPIHTLAQLKAALNGGKVGVSALSSGRVPYARAFIEYLGLVPGKNVKITAVGLGAQAALALKNHQVQALVLWDGAYAQIEQVGYPLRYFHAPWEKGLFSGVIAASDKTLQTNPQIAAGLGRAIAKALLFTVTNPAAAVQTYWAEFPQAKPQPAQEQQAMKQALAEIAANIPNWKSGIGPKADWGSQTASQWTALQKFAYGQKLIPHLISVHQYFTTKLQKQIDGFNHNAVIQQAKNFKPSMIKFQR